MEPIIEAYVGEYASGKSENAVNRAIDLCRRGLPVTLVDLDTVEPVYTIRPIKKELEAMGMNVVAWETRDTVGLGEAGSVIKGAMRWVLRRPGNIIMDVGYGVHGARIFNLIEGAFESPYLKIIAVINMSRPFTSTVDNILEYVATLGRVDALLNNTHMAEETTVEIVQNGARGIAEAAKKLGLPIVATSAVRDIAAKIGPTDAVGNPVWPLERIMPRTFW
jgi:predicted TIM-barrel fold metal-dependent hydrolase